MSRALRQSTAQTERIGPFLDATDGVTEEVGLTTPATRISKDGGAFEAGTAAGTHDEDGWYPVTFSTGDTDTLGSLVIKSQDPSVHLAVWHEFMVLPADVYDALVLGTDELDVNVIQADGTSGAVNAIAAGIGPQKNQAFSDLEFLMVLSSDGQTPATGLTVTGERSIDGGAFASVSGSIAEVSDGMYQFDADAADMNGATVTFRFSSATALDTFITIKTTP